MRHHQLSLAALALAGLISFPTAAQQTVTHVYRGVVTLVSGEQPDAIDVGDPVTVTYTVDPAAPDSDPSLQDGVYFNGLRNLSVSLPESDFAALGGVGQIQTFDNTSNPDDQVSLFTGSIVQSDDLQGLPVRALELVFIGGTDMLSSDAVPTSRLVAHDNVVHIATDQGWTSFLFTVDAEPTVGELVEYGIWRLQAAFQAGAVIHGVGNALATKLNLLQVAFDAGDTQRSCALLNAFSAQLSGIAHGHLIDASLTAEMRALAQELKLALGACQAL